MPESLSDCLHTKQLQQQFYREKRRVQMETMQISRMDASRHILFEQLQATEDLIASVGDRMTVRYSTELTVAFWSGTAMILIMSLPTTPQKNGWW